MGPALHSPLQHRRATISHWGWQIFGAARIIESAGPPWERCSTVSWEKRQQKAGKRLVWEKIILGRRSAFGNTCFQGWSRTFVLPVLTRLFCWDLPDSSGENPSQFTAYVMWWEGLGGRHRDHSSIILQDWWGNIRTIPTKTRHTYTYTKVRWQLQRPLSWDIKWWGWILPLAPPRVN